MVLNVDQMDQRVFARLGGLGGGSQQARFLAANCASRTSSVRAISLKPRRTSSGSPVAATSSGSSIRWRRSSKSSSRCKTIPNTNIWQEIQPLQLELNAGLFGDDSLYGKTIRRTLSPEQAARFESLSRERKAIRFRATVEWFVAQLDKGLGLTDQDRLRFVELLVNEARPPRKFGQGDYWYLMLQTARLPEAKLKPIFDAPQWRILSRQFAQARAMAQRLKATGVLVDDEDEDEKAAIKDSPAVPVRPAVSERKAVKSEKP